MKFRLIMVVLLLGILTAGSMALPSNGTLYVASIPSGATILINGTDYGTTNQFVKNVPAGIQNLTLTKEGYQATTILVEVPTGSLKTLHSFTLTKGGDAGVPGVTGSLYVASIPSGATILINGTDYGRTNQFVKNVPAGVQDLTLTKEGYQPKTIQVDVPAGGLKVLGSITLTKGGDAGIPGGSGSLYVASIPSGATILINGTDYGTTNHVVKNVPAGVQDLTLTKEGYQPKTIPVNVPAGGLKVLGSITLTKAAGGPDEIDDLQAAVDAASEGDTIILKQGTYYENVVIQKSLTLIGSGPGLTIINGNTGNEPIKGGVINITKPFPHASSGPNVTLVGMTITQGNASYGGGIFNGGGNLSLSQVSITNSTASFSGGGIYNQMGTITMNGSAVAENTAKVGAGVMNDGSTFLMNNGSSITGNTAQIGGGLDNIQGTVIMNEGSSITNNSATYDGGGIYSYFYSTITLNGGIITRNTAGTGTGGGIYTDSDSTVNLSGGNVSGNSPDDIYYSS